jgi:hypothetical protein
MATQFSIKYIRNGNYLRISLMAPVTRDLANEMIQQLEQECDRRGCSGYLFDVRSTFNDSTVQDNYEFANWDLKALGVVPRVKGAVLTAANDDTHSLPVLMLRTAGYDVHDFSDEQEAVTWLTGSG